MLIGVIVGTEDDAASEVIGDCTATAVGTAADEVTSTVTVEVRAADDDASEAAIIAATSAALIEVVGVVELEATVVEATAFEELNSWAATGMVDTVESEVNTVEATVGSLDEVLLRPIT